MAGPVTVRLLSHGAGRGPSTLLYQKNINNSAGQVVDLPPNCHDVNIMLANGWSKSGGSGTTAQRPTTVSAGEWYIDTTINKAIQFDGVGWRDPVTGGSV